MIAEEDRSLVNDVWEGMHDVQGEDGLSRREQLCQVLLTRPSRRVMPLWQDTKHNSTVSLPAGWLLTAIDQATKGTHSSVLFLRAEVQPTLDPIRAGLL